MDTPIKPITQLIAESERLLLDDLEEPEMKEKIAQAQMKLKPNYIRKEMTKSLGDRYEELKKLYEQELDSETLRKFKILNEAYTIGKQLYHQNFSVKRLSVDFNLPYSTVKRILSLRYANKRSWQLINEGKITAFKMAQICLQTSRNYQDEVVEYAIANHLSTSDLKRFRPKSMGDIKRHKVMKAIKEGYSREKAAWARLKHNLEVLEEFSKLPLKAFPSHRGVPKQVISKTRQAAKAMLKAADRWEKEMRK